MAIKDLQLRQGNVDLVFDVAEVGEVREFTKFGRTMRVATAKVTDESGQINLSLWNEQIDMVKPGLKIHIINGYVNEFQGEPQLTTGKLGKLEVVEGSESGQTKSQNTKKQPEIQKEGAESGEDSYEASEENVVEDSSEEESGEEESEEE